MEGFMTRYNNWVSKQDLDGELMAELLSIKDDKTAIEDSFYKDLSFGTGGLRGVLGAGSNKMNIYTVAKATRGLGEYLTETFAEPSCAIAYDSRNKSDVFAQIAAVTLATMGVKVYIYKELVPTPMLSYAVRELSCSGGIVITASHNPAKYNGYKVYGADGCQLTLEAADLISDYMKKQDEFIAQGLSFDNLLADGKIIYISDELSESYYAKVIALSLQKPTVPLNVVYSALNGAGNKPVRKILDMLGNIDVTVVKEQENPDGNFPTCPYPNPEIEEAMRLSAKYAADNSADFFLATDPDCDRVGAGYITDSGVRLISGNEMGIMLTEYLCKQHIEMGTMPKNPIVVKTIVTTEMLNAVAKKYGFELINVLTGFKFIGEQIAMLEQKGEENRFIIGFEESYGYLSGSFVRDKDAVIASMLICEMAAYYKAKGKTLLDVLNDAYNNYGYYKQGLLTFEFEGASGMAKMNEILDVVRSMRGKSFAGKAIINMVDYENDDTGLPKSNVVSMELEGGCYVIVRPSGTEPKLKLYLTAVGENLSIGEEKLAQLTKSSKDVIENI